MQDFISQITSPGLQARILPLKIIFLTISIGFISLIIYFMRRSDWWKFYFPKEHFQAFAYYKDFERRKRIKVWEKIKLRLEKESPAEYKLAIIEADGFLNDILERMGYAGESLGERLKKVPGTLLPNIDDVWEAHKVRNNIVHDPDYSIDKKRAQEIIEIYEKTFKTFDIF